MRSGQPESRCGDTEHRSGDPETRSGDPETRSIDAETRLSHSETLPSHAEIQSGDSETRSRSGEMSPNGAERRWHYREMTFDRSGDRSERRRDASTRPRWRWRSFGCAQGGPPPARKARARSPENKSAPPEAGRFESHQTKRILKR